MRVVALSVVLGLVSCGDGDTATPVSEQALPTASRVIRDEEEHPPVVVQLPGDGYVLVDPREVLLGNDTMLSAMNMKGGLQQVTLDEFALLLDIARDSARPDTDRRRARVILLRVQRDVPWQHVAWVATTAVISRMTRLEFEVDDGTGKIGRFPVHVPTDAPEHLDIDIDNPYAFRASQMKEPHVEIEATKDGNSVSWLVNGVPCSDLEDVKARLMHIPNRATAPTIVRIGWSMNTADGVRMLDMVRSIGFERLWWALNPPPPQVNEQRRLPSPQ